MAQFCINSADLNIILGPNYVPEGNYNVRLQDMSLNLAKENHHYIIANFEILDGPYNGRSIKQIWTFRKGRESSSIDRINNFVSRISNEKIDANDNTIKSVFSSIYSRLINQKFVAQFIKNVDTRCELLYAQGMIF